MTGMILIFPSMEHWKGPKIVKSNASLRMRVAYKELNVLGIFVQPALLLILIQSDAFFHCCSNSFLIFY